MFKFYISNFFCIKRFGYFLPFKIYTKFKFNFDRTSIVSLDSRLTIGDRYLSEISLTSTSVILKKNANLFLGKSVVLGGGVLLFVKDNAMLCIGDNTYITADTRIECVNSISIGSNCAISWGVTILDDDHHKMIYKTNLIPKENSGIVIGNKVWIGCNVTILKNTTIGNNSVIAAGSVVRGSFPANVLIGGNPARIIRQNVNWK